MLLLNSELVLKSLDEATGEFEGLAAVYGNVDNQGDRIEPGAFAGDDGREIPLLWNHKGDPIGVGKLEDSPEGVKLKGRLLLNTTAGREAYERLKAGAARGLSVGFRLLKDAAEGAVRRILAGAIAEVSLTPFPANPAALVTAVKADNPYAALMKFL
jgi:uncharacterized protein